MHTFEWKNGWRVHHNGDFSGMIGFRKAGMDAPVEIPFDLLVAVVAGKIRHNRHNEIDSTPDDALFSWGRKS